MGARGFKTYGLHPRLWLLMVLRINNSSLDVRVENFCIISLKPFLEKDKYNLAHKEKGKLLTSV